MLESGGRQDPLANNLLALWIAFSASLIKVCMMFLLFLLLIEWGSIFMESNYRL